MNRVTTCSVVNACITCVIARLWWDVWVQSEYDFQLSGDWFVPWCGACYNISDQLRHEQHPSRPEHGPSYTVWWVCIFYHFFLCFPFFFLIPVTEAADTKAWLRETSSHLWHQDTKAAPGVIYWPDSLKGNQGILCRYILEYLFYLVLNIELLSWNIIIGCYCMCGQRIISWIYGIKSYFTIYKTASNFFFHSHVNLGSF